MTDKRARGTGGDRPGGWLAATLIVLACTGFVRYQNTPDRSLGQVVGAERRDGGDFLALAVFQIEDCAEAAEYLRVFADPAFAGVIEVRGLVAGSGDDLQRAAARLGSEFRGISLRRAGRRDRLALATLGYRATPYVLVTDRAGRLRWTSGPPATAADWLALRASLRALTGIDTEATS